jgi:transposase
MVFSKWGIEQVSALHFLLLKRPEATLESLRRELLPAYPTTAISTVATWRSRLAQAGSPEAAVEQFRRPPRESTAQRNRRQLVSRLIRQKRCRKNKVMFLFPSAAAVKKELAASHGVRVSKSTVVRDLHRTDHVSRVRRYTPTRAPDDVKRRYQFALQHRNDRPDDLFFTDEVVVHTNDSFCRTQWVKRGNAAVSRTKKRWPAKVMVWCGISKNYRHMVIFDYKKAQGKLTAEGYKRRVLQVIAPSLISKRLTLIQDGARPHVAKLCRDYLIRKGVSFEDRWPARSPMLNVIEELWPHLHAGVARRMPDTHEELIAAVNAAWLEIPQSVIDKLIDSYTAKLQKCIRSKGDM